MQDVLLVDPLEDSEYLDWIKHFGI